MTLTAVLFLSSLIAFGVYFVSQMIVFLRDVRFYRGVNWDLSRDSGNKMLFLEMLRGAFFSEAVALVFCGWQLEGSCSSLVSCYLATSFSFYCSGSLANFWGSKWQKALRTPQLMDGTSRLVKTKSLLTESVSMAAFRGVWSWYRRNFRRIVQY